MTGAVGAQQEYRARILIVDDAALFCEGLKRTLRQAGFEGFSANDGHTALDMIHQERFDLVITDVRMPHMSGVQLVKEIACIAPELSCIVVTGNATKEEIRQLASASNVLEILVKPWNPERLVTAIHKALGSATADSAQTATS